MNLFIINVYHAPFSKYIKMKSFFASLSQLCVDLMASLHVNEGALRRLSVTDPINANKSHHQYCHLHNDLLYSNSVRYLSTINYYVNDNTDIKALSESHKWRKQTQAYVTPAKTTY